jgi:transcriptional regulator with XRE-family HTH domain
VELHDTFLAALRAAREASGRSQADVAERVALLVEGCGRLERGRFMTRASTLMRLARTLNLGVGDLRSSRIPRVRTRRGCDDLRLRAVLGRLRETSPEDLRLLKTILIRLVFAAVGCGGSGADLSKIAGAHPLNENLVCG